MPLEQVTELAAAQAACLEAGACPDALPAPETIWCPYGWDAGRVAPVDPGLEARGQFLGKEQVPLR